MKKKLVIFAGGLMIAALSAVAFFAKSQNTETSLLMRNVEALAQNEGPNGGVERYSDPYLSSGTWTDQHGCIGYWYESGDDCPRGPKTPCQSWREYTESFRCIYF